MSERLPPAIAIFCSETVRRRVMPRLGTRVAALRYDPAHTIKTAFLEELNQAMAAAAEHLRPDVSPALAVAIIADPARPALDASLAGLIKSACPPNVNFVPLWVTLQNQSPRAGTTFVLSTTWRGAPLQGGSLDRAYQSLILSLLATETSRVDFDCFDRLRFHSPGITYKVATDPIDLPNFEQQAEAQLRQAILSSYFPEIDARARQAAARIPAVEPTLCNAIAQSENLTQAAALLHDDLQIALIHWMSTQTLTSAQPELAAVLFGAQNFPLLHELKPHPRSQQAFKKEVAKLCAELIKQKRAELDADYYELLPSDLNSSQRLAVASQLSNTNGAATRLTVTRHFPADLIRDTREEILDLRDFSTVLYSMELRPT